MTEIIARAMAKKDEFARGSWRAYVPMAEAAIEAITAALVKQQEPDRAPVAKEPQPLEPDTRPTIVITRAMRG